MELSQFLSQLYDEYSASLFYYAMSLLKCEADAEEVLQNLFLGVVQQKGKLAQIKEMKGYLFAGARKEALKMIRSKTRYEQKLENFQEIARLKPKEEKTRDELEVASLEQAIEQLPIEQKEVLVLKHFSQLTFREIADILETSMDTVASRYRYGIQKLKKPIKEKVWE